MGQLSSMIDNKLLAYGTPGTITQPLCGFALWPFCADCVGLLPV
jgi:hypothetical protein